jgi:hypothetical protein
MLAAQTMDNLHQLGDDAPPPLGRGGRADGRLPGLASAGLGLLLVLLMFWTIHGAIGGRFLYTHWMFALVWLAPVWLLAGQGGDAEGTAAQPGFGRAAIPLFCMALYLFSGAARNPWLFFINWTGQGATAGPAIDCALDAAILATALWWAALCLWPRLAGTRALLAVLLLAQAVAAAKFFHSTGGAALYRDDHPSFIFRLWQFGEVFPRIVTYNPFWNGGVTDAVLTSTGVTGIGLLWWPFWRWLPTLRLYTPLFAATFIVFVPAMAALSVRVAGFSRCAALCAALFGLGVSSEFFLWQLHFGTVGAALAQTFILPLSAGLYRALVLGRRDTRTAAWIVCSAFMLVQWPPGWLIGAAVAAGALAFPRCVSLRAVGFLAACLLALAALMAREVLAIALKNGDVIAFVLKTSASGHTPDAATTAAATGAFRSGLATLATQLARVHPLLLFGGVAGLPLLRDRRLARWLLPSLVAMALIAGWAPEFFPRFQLGRLSVPLAFLMILPAAAWVGALLDRTERVPARSRGWCAVILALLSLGAWHVGRAYGNGGPARFVTAGEPLRQLTDLIRRDCPAAARVLFAGRTVHAYGGGHVAPLPLMAGREMMACDYYHFPLETVEYNYPPREFRKTPGGLRQFFDLYNVGMVVTCLPNWIDCLQAETGLVARAGVIASPGGWPCHAFRVLAPPGPFVRGTGQINATFNRIRVTLDDPRNTAVIRYNWEDRLRADGPAETFPFEAAPGVRLIGIRPNGRREVVLSMTGWL